MLHTPPLRIALVGDYQGQVIAHQAIPRALELAALALDCDLAPVWLPTDTLRQASDLDGYAGIWCVPASPYRSTAGALTAIRHARETGTPFLGTCGGFQHAVLEYARHVLGWHAADHAETAPMAELAVISPLSCALIEETGLVQLRAGSRLAAAYGTPHALESYHCRYGINPALQASLLAGPLVAVAHDAAGEVRAVELTNHPFFIATLFQAERGALQGRLPALVAAFVRACQLKQTQYAVQPA
ncbi:hypothetical protein GCM10007907_22260 [Chitinimonas prasina]|uniref:CTP synthase (glutamine hydrolyzing) n=1 Tax=Chitinimonas prasina TaxID=1434937 RepID=A0ABQ5YFR7_9NEIS|nr:CTP synthase [Chitinimonas prasina]GLR13436.1 hypothetical protein GCM10007907_22260 [Chitinimonas prasina]